MRQKLEPEWEEVLRNEIINFQLTRLINGVDRVSWHNGLLARLHQFHEFSVLFNELSGTGTNNQLEKYPAIYFRQRKTAIKSDSVEVQMFKLISSPVPFDARISVVTHEPIQQAA